jgi:hypothetical protein
MSKELSSYPTRLQPWYVVYKDPDRELLGSSPSYFSVEGHDIFTLKKKNAQCFTNIHSAARVAASEKAMIRALVTKEEGEEFGQ